MLPAHDAEHLKRFPGSTVSVTGGMLCVLIPDFALPPGLNRSAADLLLRLAPAYPDVPPDMWWFDPEIRRKDGAEIPATQVKESHLGRQWQRWSRHFNPGQWKSGVDSLESLLALVRMELLKAAAVQAA